jgi:hypothetical protein
MGETLFSGGFLRENVPAAPPFGGHGDHARKGRFGAGAGKRGLPFFPGLWYNP